MQEKYITSIYRIYVIELFLILLCPTLSRFLDYIFVYKPIKKRYKDSFEVNTQGMINAYSFQKIKPNGYLMPLFVSYMVASIYLFRSKKSYQYIKLRLNIDYDVSKAKTSEIFVSVFQLIFGSLFIILPLLSGLIDLIKYFKGI